MKTSSSSRPGYFWAKCESWLQRHTGGWCFGWVYLLALVAYLPTAASTVQEADAGQFLALGAQCLNSGWPVAHPPGYPVQTAISCGAAWLAKAMPAVPAAMWLAWASAMVVATAAGVAFSALTRLGIASPAQSVLAVGASFLARDAWRAATSQESHALGMLTLTAGLLLPVLARHLGNQKSARWLWALAGASFGVGFANHHTTAIALPGALWCLWRASREGNKGNPIAAFFAAGALAGALPVLVVIYRVLHPQDIAATGPMGPVPAFQWIWPSSDPLGYLLRMNYGTFSLAAGKISGGKESVSALWLFLRELPVNVGWIWIVAAVHGAFVLTRRRGCAIPFGLAVVMAGIFLSLMRLDPSSEMIDIVRRFHPFALITLFPFMASGLADFAGRAGRKLFLMVVAVALAIQVAVTLPEARRDLRVFPEQHFRAALEMVPPGSLVVAGSDQEIFGLSYAQVALGIRPDVRVLNLLEWGAVDKRPQVLARTGIDPASMINLNRGELVGMLATREPVWIIDAPMPPRPAYLAKTPCVGPYLVLDLRKNPEVRANQPVAPKTESRPWYVTDQGLLDKYESCNN